MLKREKIMNKVIQEKNQEGYKKILAIIVATVMVITSLMPVAAMKTFAETSEQESAVASQDAQGETEKDLNAEDVQQDEAQDADQGEEALTKERTPLLAEEPIVNELIESPMSRTPVATDLTKCPADELNLFYEYITRGNSDVWIKLTNAFEEQLNKAVGGELITPKGFVWRTGEWW